MQDKLCLVLGANGFIGSHLVDSLAGSGYKVRAFDRFGKAPQFSQHENVETYRSDIYQDDFEQALEGVDYVFHSFSATNPAASDNDPYSDIDKNLKPSVQFFQKCVEKKVKKIVFISSGGAVYGHISEDHPVTERDVATPVSPYGITKLAIEGYLAYFNQKQGIEYVVYRLTNPYGPRQVIKNGQGFIPIVIDNMLQDKEVLIYGDGSMSRDYIYINDAVQMMIDSFQTAKHRIYNIGSGQQTNLNTLITNLERVAQKEIRKVYHEAPKTFLQKTEVSIERYTSEFGSPQFLPIEEGLKTTFQSHLESS